MADNNNTLPFLQPKFLLLHKETFSLCCFDMPGCLVAGKKNLLLHTQVSDSYSHGKCMPHLDADCLWRSPFVQNNSVSRNTGPGTVNRPSDEMCV